jgi:hypothetical protein
MVYQLAFICGADALTREQGRPPLRIPCVPCGLLATRRVFTTSAVAADNSSAQAYC